MRLHFKEHVSFEKRLKASVLRLLQNNADLASASLEGGNPRCWILKGKEWKNKNWKGRPRNGRRISSGLSEESNSPKWLATSIVEALFGFSA